MGIDEKQVNKFMKGFDVNKNIEAMVQVENLLKAIKENQEQVIPGMCSLWDRILYVEQKIDYLMILSEKIAKNLHLPFEQFMGKAPKEHCDMDLED